MLLATRRSFWKNEQIKIKITESRDTILGFLRLLSLSSGSWIQNSGGFRDRFSIIVVLFPDTSSMDPNVLFDEKSESRLYIGNLDFRITEGALIKMFSPYGKIVAEEFLLHTRGPKQGEPRGFAFVQFSSKEEAELAKEKMNGRLACGRPLIVRLASEKLFDEATQSSSKTAGETYKTSHPGSSSSLGQMSKSAKIAAIKNKLKTLEAEKYHRKKQKTMAER